MSSARSPRRNGSRFKKHFLRRLSSWLVLSTSLTVLVGKVLNDAQAASVYWDINGSTAGASGSGVATGIWDASNPFWNDSTGIGAGAIWSSGDTAIFAAGGNATGTYTVTVSGTQGIGGLTFEEGFVTLAGGTLQMTNNSNFDVAANLTATVNSVIGGGFELHKTGAGTLVLGGPNTYTGLTVIEAGTLSIFSDGNLGTAPGAATPGSITFAGNSTLQITGTGNPAINSNRGIAIGNGFTGTVQVTAATNTVVYGGLIVGASDTTFKKIGPGTLELQGASVGMAGTVNIDGGTLKLSNGGALTGVAAVIIGNRGLLTLDNGTTNSTDRSAGPIASSGGTINFIGNAAATTETLGAITLNAGALTINTTPGAGGSILTIPTITRNAGGTLYVTGTGLGTATNQVVLTTANALTNTILPWAVVGNGTVIRFATHGGNGTSLAPQTTGYAAAEGSWTANTVNALPTASQALAASRTVYSLTLDSGINLTAATSDRTLTIGSGGIGAVLQTGGTSTIGQTGTIDNILAFGANEAVFHILGTLQTIRADSTAGLTGSAGLTKSGPGTLILGGQSTLTGTYRVNEGILEVRRADALGASQAIHLNGGMLRLSADTAFTLSGSITVNADSSIQTDRVTAAATATTHTVGTLTIGGGRVLSVSSNDITSGTAYGLTTGAVTLTTGGATFDVANNGAGLGTMTVGTVSGGFLITKTGAGDLMTNSITASFGSRIDIQAGRIGWSGASGTLTESQVLSGAGGIFKSGDNFVVLTGANTFTGGVAVTDGTLRYSTVSDNGGPASNLGQGTDGITLIGGTNLTPTLSFVGSTSQSTNRGITVSGGTSTLDASGTSGATITFTGAINTAGIGLTLAGSGAGFIKGGIIQSSTSADLNVNSGTWTLSDAPIVIADDVFVAGATTVFNLNSTGVLTYTTGSSNGLYLRTGGTVNINAADFNGVANSGGLDFILVGEAGAGILNTNGFNITVPRLDVGDDDATIDTGTINGNSTITVASDFNFYRGAVYSNLAGAAAVEKFGIGTLTFYGDNSGLTATTAVRIDAGNLVLDYTLSNTDKLRAATGLDMRGGTLTINGSTTADTTQTVASLTLASGGQNAITVNSGSTFAATLNLGAITRGALANDGTLRLVLPANGSITTTSVNNNATAMGILGGWVTINTGTTIVFARNDGSNRIVAANSTGQDDISLWVAGDNIHDVNGFTGSVIGAVGINSLRFNADANGDSPIPLSADAVLGIATGGILMTGNVTTGAHFISGGVLASGISELIFIQESATAPITVTSSIVGSTGITKAGGGVLVLAGVNIGTGPVDLQAGILVANGGNAIGDSSVITLADDRASTLIIGGNETVGTIGGGNSTAGYGFGAVDIGANTLTLKGGASYGGVLSGTGTIVKDATLNTTSLNLTGSTTTGFTGTVIINGGTMVVSGASGRLSGATSFTLNKTAAFLIDNNDDTAPNDRLSDTAAFVLNSADGVFSGQTITRGLAIRTDNGNGEDETIGVLTFNSGASYLSGETTATNGTSALIAENFVRANNATVSARGRALGAGSAERNQFRIGNATNQTNFIGTGNNANLVGGGGAAASKNISIVPWAIGEITTGALLDTNMGNSLVTYVSGAGFRPLDLTTEYNTFATKTTNTDNIRESRTADLTGIAGTVVNALVLNNNNTATSAIKFSGTGAGQTLGVTSGVLLFTLNSAAVSPSVHQITLEGFDAGITMGGAGVTNEYLIYVVNPSSAATAPAFTVTINSPLTSSADLTKSGRGTLILTASNTAGGGASKTTLNEGTLQIAALSNIGGLTGGLVFAGGGLQLAPTFNVATNDLSTRTLSFLPGGGTIDTNGLSPTFSNPLGSGSGTFTKAGAGNLTLNAGATLTGGTVISGGTITLGANQAIGTGDLTVAAGSTLAMGAFSLSVANVTLPNSATASLTGTGTLTGSGTMIVNQGTVTPVLAGDMNLIKQTASQTVQLDGVNSYTGYTQIQNGTLRLGSIADAGVNSAIGAPIGGNAAIRLGSTTTVGVLQYTGADGATNRLFWLTGTTGGGTIDNDGTGVLTLNGNIHSVEGGAKVLTLQGTAPGTSVLNGAITEAVGTVTLTKAEAGTWRLNGINRHSGGTNINAGTLIAGTDSALGTGTVTFGGTATLDNANANRSFANNFVVNATTATLSGTGNFNFTGSWSTTGGNRIVAVTSTGTTTFGDAATDSFTIGENNQSRTLTLDIAGTASVVVNAAILAGTGTGADAFTKLGAGNLTINAPSTYAGATTLEGGTVTINADQNLTASTNTLVIGNASSSAATMTLDLTNASATFGGAMTIQTNSVTANEIKVGVGKTLTINNNVTIGTTNGGTTAVNFTGGGSMVVNTTAAASFFTVGGNTSTGNKTIADLSGLSSLTISLNTTDGVVRVNPISSTNVTDKFSVLTLPSTGAGTTTITAATLSIGDGGVNNDTAAPFDQINQLKLGSGVNTFNVNTVNIGTGSRDAGAVTFNTATGSIVLQGTSGGPVTFNMGTGSAATSAGADNVFDVSGHNATLVLGAVNIGTQAARVAAMTNLFAFDQGTLSMQSLNLSSRNTAGGTTSTFNIGGGTVTSGAITMATTGAAAGLAVANLNITGGTVTLSGSILKGGGAGNDTANFTFNGANAVLDLGGFTLGGSGAAALDSITIGAGTLKNVAEINGGATLVKTTSGTLTMDGTNTYTGANDFQNGTVILAGGGNNRMSTGTTTLGSGVNSTVLQLGNAAGATNQTINLLTIAGTGTANAIVGGSSGYSTLTLNVATNTTYDIAFGGAGSDQNNFNLVKTGVGEMILTGTANTYTGSTTVSGGKFLVENLGGFSTTSAGLTVGDGTEFTLRGSGLTSDVSYGFSGGAGNKITIGNGAGTTILGFRLDGAFNTQLKLLAGQTLTIVTGSTLQTAVYVDDAPIAGHAYVLIDGASAGALHAGGGLFDFNPVVFNGGSFSYALSNVTAGGVDRWVITPTAVPAAPDVWWKGDLTGIATGVWSASTTSGTGFPTNWDTSQSGGVDASVPPDSGSIVHFSAAGAANFATTLGANLTVQELIFHAGGTAVSVDGNAGLYTLTLGNTVDGSGISLLAGAPNVTISADLFLAQSQSFNIADSLSILTISGNMGGSGTLGINDNGSSVGRLILAGAGTATYSGATNLVTGRLVLNGGVNNRLPVATDLTMGDASLSAVLQLGDATNGAMNQAIGSLNTGSATANSIVGGAAAVSTLTVTQGTAGTFRGIIGGAGANENNVALVKQGAATLILAGANTYTGGTTVRNGTLQLGSTGGIVGALTINAQAGATAIFDNNSRTTVLTGGLTFGGGDASALAQLVNTGGGGSFTIGGNILYDGTNNPLGASIDIPINLGSTVRTITVNDSSTAAIDLAITASLNIAAGTNGTGLTLDGTGTGQISAPIVLPGGGDNSASDLTKNGTGTWIVSSTISMSDDVAHNAGTITITGVGARITVGDDFITDNATTITNLNVVDAVQGTSSTSNGLYARSGSTINVNANGAIGALMDLIVLGDDNQGIGNLVMNADASVARLDLGFNSTGEIGNVTGTGTLSGLSTINLNNGIVSANLAGVAGNIVKDNFTVTLSGNNNLGTGTTGVTSGNLVLDFTTFAGTNSKIGTGILTMGSTISSDGSALLTLTGNAGAASLQNVAGLASAGGPSTIAINAVSGFDTVLRVTGPITQTGGTINLVLANANSRLEYTGATANSNGIIGGWFTIGSNRFATILESGAVDVITAVTNTVKNDVTTWNPGDNVINSAAFTGSVATTSRLNSVTFDAAAASNISFGDYLIVQGGGLLVTANVGANATTLTGGRLVSESGALFIHQHDTTGVLTIGLSILDKTPVTKTGDGTLVLSGTNLLGQLNINGGTVRVSGGDALSDTAAVDIRSVTGATLEIAAGVANSEVMGSLAGDGTSAQLIIGTGAVLTVNQSAAETFAGIISGGGDFVKQGTSALTISGDASMTGAVMINAGRITLSGATGRLNEASSYTLNGGELLIVQDQSSSQDRLRDAGTITLNNTGGTIGLRIQNTNQNSTKVDNVGPIVLGAGHNVITAEGTTGTGTGTLTIADLLADSLSRGSNRATLLVSGLDLGSSAATRKGYIRFESAATATLNGFEVGGTGGAGTTTIPIIPWMIGDLTTAGLGNTFVTYVDGTTGLRPLAATEYISDSIGITGALTNNIRFTGSAAITATPTAINSLVLDAASAIALTGSASAMEITTGSILAAGAGNHSVGTISALTTGGGRDYTIFVTTPASTFTVDSPLTSAVPLVKSGAGTLKLTNTANAFTDTYLNQGTVLVNDYDKLGSGGLYFAGGIFKLDTGFADDLGAKAFHLLTGGGTLDIGTLNVNATNLAMSGAGPLTKIGTGTLTVGDSAALTHTGMWNVGAGTVILNNALGNVIGVGGLVMTSAVGNTIVRLNLNDQIADTAIVDLRAVSGFNQLLDLNNKTDTIGGLYVSSATTGGATVKTGATGVLTVNGDIYLNNNRQADASTTEFQVLITGSGAIASRTTNGFLDLGGANRRIFVETTQAAPTRNDAVIETVIRNGGIIKEGSRVLYLRAANTYSGKTQINAGTITITAANNLGDGSATNTIGIANGATLRSNGASVDLGTNRSIALSGATANIEVDSPNVLTASGVITGDQRTTLVKNGSGTLALTATNTFTGVTRVNAGELIVAGSLAGDVNLSAGATSTILSSDQAAQVAGIAASSSATSGAVIDPGRSGGSGTSTIGALTADGNVTLGTTGTAFSAQIKLEIGGTVAGTSYDQLNVTGGRTVSLDNVALSLTAVNGYQFTLPSFSGGQMQTDGAKFFVLTLGAGSTLSGTFQGTNLAGDPGLPGFSTITLGGQMFAINYTADFDTNNFAVGSGNDVALMAIPEPNALGMLTGSLGLALGLQRFRRRPRLN